MKNTPFFPELCYHNALSSHCTKEQFHHHSRSIDRPCGKWWPGPSVSTIKHTKVRQK